MTVQYSLENTNGHNYILGWCPGGDYEVPSFLLDEMNWLDEYGNRKWELLGDGSVIAANIAPTRAQLDQKAENDRVSKITELFLRTVVRSIRGTSGPAQSWSAIDAELRAKLT